MKFTEEHRKRMSLARMGKSPSNKGISPSSETRAKLSLALKGRTPWNKGLKGVQQSWNKGLTKETNMIVKNISDSKLGQLRPTMIGNKFRVGKRPGNYKGGITPQGQLQRVVFRKKMQKLIFERDGYKCQICSSNKDLQVDHIMSWSEFKELRFDPENCRTLCAKCHYKITYSRDMPDSVKSWGHNLKNLKSRGGVLK